MDRGALQALVAPLSYKESYSREATEHKHTLSEAGHSRRYLRDSSLYFKEGFLITPYYSYSSYYSLELCIQMG